MRPIQTILQLTLISTVLVGLTGCSSLLSSQMPTGGVSMAQSYDAAINGTGNTSPLSVGTRKTAQQLAQIKANLDAKTQAKANAIQNLFPQMKNPNVVMYVYPHLAMSGNTQVPVPGYTTVFSLYKSNHYAVY